MSRTRVALGMALLLAITPACFLFGKPAAQPRGPVRIVAPGPVAEPYFGTAPGGRFAVLADAIVDLPNARIAWRAAEPVHLAFASRPHTLLRESKPDTATDTPKGIELWNALSGRVESSFAGTLLPHSDLDGLMPLQDRQELAIIDAVTPRELARVPMADEALSAVLRGEELLVLSRKRASAQRVLAQEQLTLHSFKWPSAEPAAKQLLNVDWRGHQPKPATERRSPPFLHRDEQGALGVGRLFRSSAGDASDKTELYRVAIAANGRVQPASWTLTPFVWPEGGTVPSLADAGVRPIPRYALPGNVRDAIDRLPRVSMGSLADARDSRLLTHGDGYVCVWSLRAARREACLRVKHVAAGLADGRVWLRQDNDRVGTWSPAQGLKWEGTGQASSQESEATGLDCQLSTRNDPHGSIVVGDSEGPRFFIYDLGPDAWLIGLPDGRYAGSPDAQEKLAFYDEKGALLADETVTGARDPERVGQVLSAAISCR